MWIFLSQHHSLLSKLQDLLCISCGSFNLLILIQLSIWEDILFYIKTWVSQSFFQIALFSPLETIGCLFTWWRSVKILAESLRITLMWSITCRHLKFLDLREMGVSKKWWVFPPNHPWINKVFHYFHHPFWGPTPIFGNIQMENGTWLLLVFLRTEGHLQGVVVGDWFPVNLGGQMSFRDLGDSFAGLFLCIYITLIYIYIYRFQGN